MEVIEKEMVRQEVLKDLKEIGYEDVITNEMFDNILSMKLEEYYDE